jgi:TonB family protein
MMMRNAIRPYLVATTLWSAACLTPQLPNQTDKTAHSLKQPLPASFVGDWDLFDCTPYGAPADAGKHANAHRRCRLTGATIECVQDWDGCRVRERPAKVWSEDGQGFVDWSGDRLEGCEPKGCTPVARQTDGVSYAVLCEGKYDTHQDPIMKLSVAEDVLVLGDDEVGCKFRRVASSTNELRPQPVTPHASDAGHVLSAEEIRGVVLANLAPLRRCYESEAAQNRNWASEVTLVFQIASPGNVTDVRVKRSSPGNPRFEACVVESARHLRFPSSVNSSNVEWPFKFGPHALPNDGGT